MRYVQFSEQGMRPNNEDCCNVVEILGKRTLFVVCDGMGGHSCGDVASRTVSDVISAYWQEHQDSNDSSQKIQEAFEAAGQTIEKESERCMMGTTLVMASIEGNQATIAHAGDSRCYIIDIKGNVKYRTIDHVENGYLNNAFFTGLAQDVTPEIKVVELELFDRILLCSDGLYNAMDDSTLLHTLQCAKDVEQVADKYRLVCSEKATDNYSAIIIEMD